jgi:hypothetical protein
MMGGAGGGIATHDAGDVWGSRGLGRGTRKTNRAHLYPRHTHMSKTPENTKGSAAPLEAW